MKYRHWNTCIKYHFQQKHHFLQIMEEYKITAKPYYGLERLYMTPICLFSLYLLGCFIFIMYLCNIVNMKNHVNTRKNMYKQGLTPKQFKPLKKENHVKNINNYAKNIPNSSFCHSV